MNKNNNKSESQSLFSDVKDLLKILRTDKKNTAKALPKASVIPNRVSLEKNIKGKDGLTAMSILLVNQFYDQKNIPLSRLTRDALAYQSNQEHFILQKPAHPVEVEQVIVENESTITNSFHLEYKSSDDPISRKYAKLGMFAHMSKSFLQRTAMIMNPVGDVSIEGVYYTDNSVFRSEIAKKTGEAKSVNVCKAVAEVIEEKQEIMWKWKK